jgi:hypothetical protein
MFAYAEGLAAIVKANRSDDNVSQIETICAHDTDGCVR